MGTGSRFLWKSLENPGYVSVRVPILSRPLRAFETTDVSEASRLKLVAASAAANKMTARVIEPLGNISGSSAIEEIDFARILRGFSAMSGRITPQIGAAERNCPYLTQCIAASNNGAV